MTLQLTIESQWRRVADPDRSAYEVTRRQYRGCQEEELRAT